MSEDARDLASRLAEQRSQQHYRLRRRVRQFSHRMRASGIVAGIFVLLLSYVAGMVGMRFDFAVFDAWTPAMYALLWIYLLALPLVFIWRTGLRAYVLQEHWLWLSVLLGLPADAALWRSGHIIRFLPAGRFGVSWLPVVLLALLVAGHFLRRWREERFVAELRANAGLWERLLPFGVLDLFTMGFWSARQR